MARRNAPETCTEADDCDHTVHVRDHGQPTDALPHEDAPLVEGVCSIHGVVYSR